MTHSLPNDAVNNVEQYLQAALSGAVVSRLSVDGSPSPLLLVRTQNAVIAFAFADGASPRAAFERTYSEFKRCYAGQDGAWDLLDISFVFCLSPDEPQLDHICSRIETDVYFCRKFVVPLGSEIGKSLARLPFLPLSRIDRKPLRPPSAQTLLRQCNVPSELARFIVVQRERSPEGIFEDCLAGRFGPARDVSMRPTLMDVPDEASVEPVKLTAISVENFRAYRRRQRFELGSAVTILYGPNGFGKTSFFDAIDFAVTGGIGRLAPSVGNFSKTAQHLDSFGEVSSVSLEFSSGAQSRTLTRRVDNPKQALLDDVVVDRKQVLTQLTSGEIPQADRVENFVSLFRATHLFSQEQQELAHDFQADCQISGEIVSRMLAFEDYVNGTTKATRVEQIVHSAIVNARAETRRLAEEIDAESAELSRLTLALNERPSVPVLEKEREELLALAVELGLAESSAHADPQAIRTWRATAELRSAESASLARRMDALAARLAALKRGEPERLSLGSQIENAQRSISEIEARIAGSKDGLRKLELELAGTGVQLDDALSQLQALEWAIGASRRLRVGSDEERVLAEGVQRLTEVRSENAAEASVGAVEIEAADAELRRAVEEETQAEDRLRALRSLSPAVARWVSGRARLSGLERSHEELSKRLEAAEFERDRLQEERFNQARELEVVSNAVARSDESRSEMATILSIVKVHITDGTCPVCGVDHGSLDALRGRIESRTQDDPMSELRAQARLSHERLQEIDRSGAELELSTQELRRLMDVALRDRRVVLEDLETIEQSAVACGIELLAMEGRAERQLLELIASAEETVGRAREHRASSLEAREAARERAAKISDAGAAVAREMAGAVSRLNEARSSLEEIRKDPRNARARADDSEESLLVARGQAELAVDRLQSAVNEQTTRGSSLRVEVELLTQQLNSALAQLKELRSRESVARSAERQCVSELAELKLADDITPQALQDLSSNETSLQDRLLAFAEKSIAVELAIDSATTAAALSQLQVNVKEKREKSEQLEKACALYEPWELFFSRVKRLLTSQQALATETFTKEYGPRTSVVQRRLRSVYGFDDIEISGNDGAIDVRVLRNGETLRPTDYFSQSQQQTLLLGLFLTASSSQTWSGFSPIFLDDPVTHFDDLNTYALLDLLVGLLDSETGARQFVISTCDEKLLQLSKQKFRHLGAAAKFYRFSAFGAEGPVVELASLNS